MSTITTNKEEAITALTQEDVVAIPTETVYGLAANAENDLAVQKVFSLKQRPLNHPLILHIAKDRDVSAWASRIPEYAHQLMNAFWPGPLTLVFPSKPGKLSPLVTGGQTTLAIRCPDHPTTQSLLQALNFPLVAPSANPFGKISPTTSKHVQTSFANESLLILEGGRCRLGIESTIVSVTEDEGYQILRHGAISAQALANLLPDRRVADTNKIRVPGKLEYHYQPEKPLYCFENKAELLQFCRHNSQVFVLAFDADPAYDPAFYYQLPRQPEALAFELYYQLRLADQSLAKVLAIELPPDEEAWAGIRERLVKASFKGGANR